MIGHISTGYAISLVITENLACLNNKKKREKAQYLLGRKGCPFENHLIVSPLQIPMLLSIDEQDKALSKAIESGDTDLVYLVLFHIWQKVAVEKVNPLLPL